MRRLVYRRTAERGLALIYRYIAERGDEAVADHFTERLRERCRALAALPGTLGHARDDLRLGIRSVPEGRYLIFFRYAPGTLVIVNILHSARDLRAILPRT